MADIRNLNTFTLGAGFNVTSGEAIDSRQFVNTIDQIYSPDNWVKVKPYNGLLVVSADGEARICIDAANYQLEASWKKIGGDTTVVENLQASVTTIEQKLETVQEGAQVNAIEEVKVDGVALPIVGKSVDIDLTPYAKSADVVAQSDFDSYKEEVTNSLAAKVAQSDFDSYKEEVTNSLSSKVAQSDFDSYKEEVANSLATKADASELDKYQLKSEAETAHNELSTRIDSISEKATANETAIANLKVKDVDNTPASGIAVELTEEGKVKASVNHSTLAADLVGTAGVVGDLSGANVKIGTAITATENIDGEDVTETIIDSTATVAEAVQVLAGQIQSAVAGGITGISGDEYIKVGGTTTSKSLTLEVSKVVTAVANNLVSEDSAIQKDENDHLQLVWSSL